MELHRHSDSTTSCLCPPPDPPPLISHSLCHLPPWHLEGRLASARGSSGHRLHISAFGGLGDKPYPKVVGEEGAEPKPSDWM
ncbi:hypothetical protein FRC11_014462 [Ceratobasidium sp. 423]|nr:hypothetical protein FRC11_014462 [Ceratobasidium sp. 423]